MMIHVGCGSSKQHLNGATANRLIMHLGHAIPGRHSEGLPFRMSPLNLRLTIKLTRQDFLTRTTPVLTSVLLIQCIHGCCSDTVVFPLRLILLTQTLTLSLTFGMAILRNGRETPVIHDRRHQRRLLVWEGKTTVSEQHLYSLNKQHTC